MSHPDVLAAGTAAPVPAGQEEKGGVGSWVCIATSALRVLAAAVCASGPGG